MATQEQIGRWRREEREPFTGWDFAHLRGRMSADPLPWDYCARACELMRGSRAMLDIDTGGGEVLMSMRDSWPAHVEATEEYPPNLRLARRRLESLEVKVHGFAVGNELPMPLESGAYDLVLDRHAAFNPSEVARVLTLGGTFLTQQVHGRWAHDLLAAFGAAPQWPNATADFYVPRLQAAGMEIRDVQQHAGALRFTDVGAVVYCLKATPWMVPGFTVESHLAALLRLQERLDGEDKSDGLAFWSGHYLIEAQRT